MKKIKKHVILVIIAIISALMMCGAVSATSYSDIYVSPDGSDDNDGGDPLHPAETIEHALVVAQDSGSTIHLAEGTYNKYFDNDRRDYGITLDKNLTIAGEGKDKTIIDALGDNKGIFSVSIDCIVTFKDLTLKNGNSSMGGAIYNHGNITITNCAFINNEADAGGAIYSCYDGASTITGCTFTGNTARNNYGGGYGGAINNNAASTITGCTFNGNSADWGGGIYYDGGVSTIKNCIFTDNTAIDEGGAIFNTIESTTIVTNCIFTGNDATIQGGAILNNGELEATGSIFNGNSAAWGGAIYNAQPCECTITGCNFNKNTATHSGGAIFSSGNEGPIGATTVKYSRLVGNTAGDSGQDIHVYTGDRDDDPELIATLNWWGSNSGPAPGRIAVSMGTLIPEMYSPWLVMNILPADPSTIYTGQTSKITVNVYKDSAGSDHSADAAQFFSGPEVKFTTNHGNIGSKTVTVPWTLGIAFAILRGDEGAGTATVTAADGEIKSTTVTILQAQTVNAATVGMQNTGLPIAGLILAILAVFGGLVSSKK